MAAGILKPAERSSKLQAEQTDKRAPAMQELFRIARFILVGGLATLTDLLVSFLLVSVIGVRNFAAAVSALGISPALAAQHFEEGVTALAFMLAFAVSYYGHSSVTFHAARSRAVLLRMFAASLMALALRVALVYGIKELLGWGEQGAPVYQLETAVLTIPLSFSLNASYIPLLVSMALVTVLSYFLFKRWVFRK